MTVKRAREKYGRASSTRPRSRAQISRNEATVQIGGGSDDSGPVYDRARRAGPIRDGEGHAGREVRSETSRVSHSTGGDAGTRRGTSRARKGRALTSAAPRRAVRSTLCNIFS